MFMLFLLSIFHVSNDDICLSNVVYHEARSEPIIAQLAVARVTINRLHHNEYPDTICKVVWQKNQYTWTSKLSKKQITYDYKSLMIAKYAIHERYIINGLNHIGLDLNIPLKNAMFFSKGGFNNKRLKYVDKIGVHKFYKIKVEF